MASKNRDLLKSTLLLLGSFTFAYNASIVLHELGHAIAYWITGGTVEHIIIHPFAWSTMISASGVAYPSFTTWAGVVFCTLMGILLFVMVWRWRSPYVILVLMTGVVGCISSGVYLIYDCLAKSGGDATTLVHYGMPKIVIILVGLLMIGIGVVLWGMCLQLIGIHSSYGVKSRILVLGGSVLPYSTARFIYDLLYNREELGAWIAYWPIIIGLILMVALVTRLVAARVRRVRAIEAKKVAWPAVILAGLGAFVIFSVLFILLRPYKPKTSTRYILNYYDRESNFAGINLKITHNLTASPGKRHIPEAVVFWNWQGRKGRTQIPYLADFAGICADTQQIIVITTYGVLLVPMDGTPHRWAFKQNGILLFPAYKGAVSNDNRKVLVSGSDRNLQKWLLIALDIPSGRVTTFGTVEGIWEVVFVDTDTAVASVGTDLIRVEFADSGEHEFSVDQGAGRKGEVMAVFRGDFVFHQPVIWTEENADQHTVECGVMKIPFTEPVKYVLASESYIWAIDRNGQVFRVNPDGSKLCVGTYAPESMIGRGTFDDSLWIAFSDGTVLLFGDSKESANIELP